LLKILLLAQLLIESTTKYFRYQVRVNLFVTVHLRDFNKQHLILAIFYINNALFIANQTAKF